MRVDAHVAGCTGEALVFPVGDVLLCRGIDEELGKTEVDDVDDVHLLRRPPTNKEVFGFYVSIDDEFGMHVLYPRYLAGGWMCGWMDGWKGGWMCGWMCGWMDGWMDGRVGWYLDI